MQLILYDHDSSFVLLQQLTQCLASIINIVTYWHRLIQVPHYKQQTQALADISKKKIYIYWILSSLQDFWESWEFRAQERETMQPESVKILGWHHYLLPSLHTGTCHWHCWHWPQNASPVTADSATHGNGHRSLPRHFQKRFFTLYIQIHFFRFKNSEDTSSHLS